MKNERQSSSESVDKLLVLQNLRQSALSFSPLATAQRHTGGRTSIKLLPTAVQFRATPDSNTIPPHFVRITLLKSAALAAFRVQPYSLRLSRRQAC